ncbi:hypothetical protein AVEN_111150-1 [Araneus ventricosus]|uniref:Uncharacterized protein n=1 Tax=Araneus ventricosus TaxID=182803 RepID=A0A4Y2V0Q4_ARAVE|nr:hypothetical protein AVEN_111150-1 [Araneus ventricosus]
MYPLFFNDQHRALSLGGTLVRFLPWSLRREIRRRVRITRLVEWRSDKIRHSLAPLYIDENSNATPEDHDVKEIDTNSMYSESEESSIANDSENDSECEEAGILGVRQNSILVLENKYIPPGAK